MTGLLATLLFPTVALAWEHDAGPGTTLPTEAYGVRVLPFEGRPMVFALGGQVSWIVDPATGEVTRTLPVGARDAASVDLDADGTPEVLLCGPSGVHALAPGGVPERAADVSCQAIAVVDREHGPLVATGGDEVVLWAVDPTGELLEMSREAPPLPGARVLLSAEGELLAMSAVGATVLHEYGPPGRSTLATGGGVGGVALGPGGWSWTIPERGLVADLTHRTTPVDGQPGGLVGGDLDGDGTRDLAVLRDGGVSVLTGGEPTRLELGARPEALAVGDVDEDGCDDLVVALREPFSLRVLRGAACGGPPLAIPGPETPVPDPDQANRRVREAPDLAKLPPEPPLKRPPRFLGVEIPWFLGEGVATEPERMRLQQYVVVGSGWAMGGALRNAWLQIPFFPALSVEMEWGGPHFRWFLGGDSAALFLWMTENGGGIHLANLTTGVTFGSPRLRTGPFVTAGLLNAGAGWRTVFTPFQDGDTFKGFEVRLTWFTPATGEVMVLYVWSQPMKRARKRHAPQRDVPPPVIAAEDDDVHVPIRARHRSHVPRAAPALAACRRFGASIGVAGGGSSTRYSWEYVGSDVPLSPSVSPVVALQCETGGKGLGLLLGVESAPFFSYLTKDDDRLHHMGSHTLGVMIGGDGFRMGPTATAGVWTLGGGLRAAIRLKEDEQGLTHQLDLRAMAHWPSAPAGQLMVLYGISFDPWK